MFRTTPIKVRLILGGAISILAIVTTALVGLLGLWQSDEGAQRQTMTTVAIRHEMMADMMHEAVEADVIRATLIGPDGPPEDRQALPIKLAEDVTRFRDSITALGKLDLSPAVRQQLDILAPLIEDYLTTGDQTARIGLQDFEKGRAAIPAFMAKFGVLETQMARLGDLIQALGEKTSEDTRDTDFLLIMTLIGVSSVSTLLLIYASWSLTRSIHRPVERLRAALNEVSKGGVSIRIGDITRDDDIGAIARDIDKISDRVQVMLEEQAVQRAQTEKIIGRLGAGLRALSAGDFSARIEDAFSAEYEPLRHDYNETLEKLSHLIAQVVDASDSIRARANEISVSSEELASRTETQAATLEQTAAALEQITASVNSAAAGAKEVEAVVLRARSDVEDSGKVVQGAVNAMNQIESSSSQISQIIGVIDDIAFQTNLLALNAGVEAARAGDAGRGFAVVASEVRALAQRSSLAAKEIKVLISDSSQHVQSGVKQVDGAGRALSAVVTQVSQISKLVSAMASGSIEQAQGLNEINIGVAQLDQVTQQNVAMAERSGAACHALNHETTEMNAIVAQFTVRAPSAGRGAAHRAAEDFPLSA
jgi:methyl-accepting chemotaxis protein